VWWQRTRDLQDEKAEGTINCPPGQGDQLRGDAEGRDERKQRMCL